MNLKQFYINLNRKRYLNNLKNNFNYLKTFKLIQFNYIKSTHATKKGTFHFFGNFENYTVKNKNFKFLCFSIGKSRAENINTVQNLKIIF